MPLPHCTESDPHVADLVENLRRSEIYREFQCAFQDTTHLTLGLRSAGTAVHQVTDAKWVNPLCALLSSVNQGCTTCLTARQRKELANRGDLPRPCLVGMSHASVPVRIGETVVAFLETGQVLLHPPSTVEFRRAVSRLAKWGIGIDVKRLEHAYFRTRVLDRRHYDAVVRLLAIFAQHLSTVSNQLAVATGPTTSPVIDKAKSYIAAHATEDLSLVGVAHAMNTSPFYFCKMFRQATGLHFVDYLGRVRVEKAKNLLLNPHCRISEAAFEAGFQSLSQFNRVFRRVAGEPPTHWRGRVLSEAAQGSLRSATRWSR
ncbi:MAG TPA: helix-turn-helix domain-containing protein [Opitutaceae bacterium]